MRQRGMIILAVATVACGAQEPAAPPDAARPAPEVVPAPVEAAPAPAPEPPAYAAEVASLTLRRSSPVRLAPAEAAKKLGTVAQDTRVAWRGAAAGPGCKTRWIEIAPRGWVCEALLEPSPRPPDGVELPRLAPGELVPGAYGKVTAAGARTYADADAIRAGKPKRTLQGAVKVRRYDEVEVGGKSYWRIGPGELLAAGQIAPIEPSAWRGIRLGDDTGVALPIGFALAARGARSPKVPVASAPGGAAIRTLAPRTVVTVLERDGDWVRIDEGQWVRAADLRIAEPAAPPPLLEPGERWIDIDLDRQVLVAYEGELPVYATLVSSGERRHPTETGVYRVWVKFAETDMNGQMGDEEPYSVATVPWTQFFAKDLALHTAYWHDRFGEPRSHGCINLTPVDARFLYFWSAPDVPPGWSMAHGVVERPGSLIRVRSAADPDPEPKGYARRVHEARLARAE